MRYLYAALTVFALAGAAWAGTAAPETSRPFGNDGTLVGNVDDDGVTVVHDDGVQPTPTITPIIDQEPDTKQGWPKMLNPNPS